jgi:hypothetical protein
VPAADLDAFSAQQVAQLPAAGCVFQTIVDGRFSRSWTAFQMDVDGVSDGRGRRFRLIVDDVSA